MTKKVNIISCTVISEPNFHYSACQKMLQANTKVKFDKAKNVYQARGMTKEGYAGAVGQFVSLT